MSETKDDRLAAALAELCDIERGLHDHCGIGEDLEEEEVTAFTLAIKEWLAKVRYIAREFGARNYTIDTAAGEENVLLSASFTWPAT